MQPQQRLVNSALYGPVLVPAHGAWGALGEFTVWEQPVAERVNWSILRHKRHCASDPCAYVSCPCAAPGLHATLAGALHPDLRVHSCPQRLCCCATPDAAASPTTLDALAPTRMPGTRILVLDASGCASPETLLAGAHDTIWTHRPTLLLPASCLPALLSTPLLASGDFTASTVTAYTATADGRPGPVPSAGGAGCTPEWLLRRTAELVWAHGLEVATAATAGTGEWSDWAEWVFMRGGVAPPSAEGIQEWCRERMGDTYRVEPMVALIPGVGEARCAVFAFVGRDMARPAERLVQELARAASWGEVLIARWPRPRQHPFQVVRLAIKQAVQEAWEECRAVGAGAGALAQLHWVGCHAQGVISSP
ncbi:hypothetical protein HYH02_015189 [Chlamydomonas schloesseri]|uniref:Uncharacterized protein n=1 Tax=Chlamydomonas schloesseri TaxID=2026947 RepID=A0A835VQS9_9CHLO|nr:hypothetical protein HYH02_015189 [Chlamydomonas schloesseri]|eukprot:KAG2424330.1 hypothetical protein HYH02_015189 [Chlamydomonas schloesseri]